MVSGPGALLLSRGPHPYLSLGPSEPRCLGKAGLGLVQGGDFRLDGQSSVLSLTPLCGQPGISVLGMALGKLASCHCPPATLPEQGRKQPPSTYSHMSFKLAPALATIPQIWCLLASPLG